MKINTEIFKIMLISATNNLYNYHLDVDKLNVFPVPDGDTGTNMNLTMQNGIKEVEKASSDATIPELAEIFSRGLIWGARGNSGVILSQIFRGFSKGLVHNDEISTSDLLKAWSQAKQVAYKAVMKPVEGTILTVIRVGIDETKEQIKNPSTIAALKMMEMFLENSSQALKTTPDILPLLKEAGVVDSGGFGLVKIIEGLVYAIKKQKPIKIRKKLSVSQDNLNLNLTSEDKEYGYCSEVIIKISDSKTSDFPLEKIRFSLSEQGGSSIIAVQDKDIFKVHFHNLLPWNSMNYLQKLGEFEKIKIENMTLQSKKHTTTIKKERTLKIPWAIIAVAPGDGIKRYFKNELKVTYVIDGGQTMNPSTDDFLKAIEEVDAKEVIILPNNSNIILTAQQAAKIENNRVKGKKSKVYVLETKTIPEGIASLSGFNLLEKELKNTISEMKKAIKKVTTGQITYAVRTTTINNVLVEEGNYVGIINNKIYNQDASILEVAKQLLKRTINKSSELVIIFTGADTKIQDINYIEKYIEENFDVEFETLEGNQPVYPFIFSIE